MVSKIFNCNSCGRPANWCSDGANSSTANYTCAQVRCDHCGAQYTPASEAVSSAARQAVAAPVVNVTMACGKGTPVA